MKYRQLTKEQFEELHKEFARFLASQKIDAEEWRVLKRERPDLVEEEMNVFSDVVWEEVLTNAEFIEHYSKSSINLFKCGQTLIERIVIKTDNSDIDFQSKAGLLWCTENRGDSSLSYYYAHKDYTKERNIELFELVEKGGLVSKGELYNSVLKMIGKRV